MMCGTLRPQYIFLILVIFSLFLPRYTYRILQTRCHKALRDVFLGVALEDYLGYMHTILQVTKQQNMPKSSHW